MSHRPHDPHLDPLRAPSAQGQHPHARQSTAQRELRQNMYERRDAMNHRHKPLAGPAAQPPPPPAPHQAPEKSLWDNPLVYLGLGAAAFYLYMQMKDKGEDAEFIEEVRVNPARRAPRAPVAPPAGPVIVMPATAAMPATRLLPAAPEKKKRTRRTTQARDPKTGTYLQSGTRDRSVTEGKKK